MILAQGVSGRKWLAKTFVDSPATLTVDTRAEADALIEDYITDIAQADLTWEVS